MRSARYRVFPTRLSGVGGPGVNFRDVSLIKRVPAGTLFGAVTASAGYLRQVLLGARLEF